MGINQLSGKTKECAEMLYEESTMRDLQIKKQNIDEYIEIMDGYGITAEEFSSAIQAAIEEKKATIMKSRM